MEPDRPHWKMDFAEAPVLIRRGMCLRDVRGERFYKVERLIFPTRKVCLRPFFDALDLVPVVAPDVEVSFEDIMKGYRPTLYGDGTRAKQPLSSYERIQSGALFKDTT